MVIEVDTWSVNTQQSEPTQRLKITRVARTYSLYTYGEWLKVRIMERQL